MSEAMDKVTAQEWRELRFYYDQNKVADVEQWRIYGSRKGIEGFAKIVQEYAENSSNAQVSEHDHLGPYMYLKIMTWDTPFISNGCFAGTLDDLKKLSEIISDKVSRCEVGQSFSIDTDYGVDNTSTAHVFVMNDDFDPVSMDTNLRSQFISKQIAKLSFYE
jgi:hypothetical protein